jgi:hypothetical protein
MVSVQFHIITALDNTKQYNAGISLMVPLHLAEFYNTEASCYVNFENPDRL